jgi:hypothetical protein
VWAKNFQVAPLWSNHFPELLGVSFIDGTSQSHLMQVDMTYSTQKRAVLNLQQNFISVHLIDPRINPGITRI